MALHRHTGPTRQHMRRLLADGLGARGQCYRHGYCRGGTHTHARTHGTRRCSLVPAAGTCLSTRDCPEMSLVVTLFPPQEGGRSKSHRYWPKLGSKHNSATHGKFKVTTKFRTDSGCYATTGLKVKHLLSGQERTVWHLQYTDWPEQGCPEYVQGFLCECSGSDERRVCDISKCSRPSV